MKFTPDKEDVEFLTKRFSWSPAMAKFAAAHAVGLPSMNAYQPSIEFYEAIGTDPPESCPKRPTTLPRARVETPEPASVTWKREMASARQNGLSGAQAVAYVNRNNPGLRERYVAEANNRQGK